MPGVNRGQIDRAKKASILEYVLANEPGNVRKVGSNYFLKDHDSLEISNGLWNWHSQGIGGRNVIDYLIKVRGYSFVDAVCEAIKERPAGFDAPRMQDVKDSASVPLPIAKHPPSERKPFALPPRHRNNDKVAAYLESRGIAKPHIMGCIERGALYQSAIWCDCVFVGRDSSGKAQSASLRGTSGDFKRDAAGSDKRFGFTLPPINGISDTVAAFESPVDALSHQSLYPGFDGWRLSLGCTALIALEGFLERHREVINCIACTDNDEAGNRAAEKIVELHGISVTRSLPFAGKDWNDALRASGGENRPSLLAQLDEAAKAAEDYNTHIGAYNRRNTLEWR